MGPGGHSPGLELGSEELASCLHFLQPLITFSLADPHIPSFSPPPFYGTEETPF